ncbi:hypothetical protein LOOC260_108520 [Paucilactobacillus hokkaidonensis JCM 18461]|uniref:Uncharacterized protein n=2 Tax=Paucilactobacillus hokkaidonensis TaxID=1193095 RepID=A0A0A1GSX1_9LACO|nr:hypothetical protein [Paucilactobacillus hokkaidonensis]KRO10097.1 hypothetical protein IV59_GL002118 [Paucilactobacillus hokkaidonensis]BAP85392.1 hypothetical protein LOOC260_108520 [Paucilactobacillus hokkaidonensis JCM 18461]
MNKLQLLLITIISVVVFGGLVWATLINLIAGIWLIVAWILGFIVATSLITFVVAKAQMKHNETKEQ